MEKLVSLLLMTDVFVVFLSTYRIYLQKCHGNFLANTSWTQPPKFMENRNSIHWTSNNQPRVLQ